MLLPGVISTFPYWVKIIYAMDTKSTPYTIQKINSTVCTDIRQLSLSLQLGDMM